MDVFSLVNDEKTINLTEDNYHKKTYRKYPYYQNEKHFAVCPECKNPILIVNLYNNQVDEDGKKSYPLYARHISYDVKGIATYSEQSYLDCSLSNPSSITTGGKRSPGAKTSIDILDIIKNHYSTLYGFMCKTIGIRINDKLFKEMIANFTSEEGHLYRGVTRYNLPYTFLYMTDNTKIHNQFLINKNPIAIEIKKAIDKNCTEFEVDGTYIKPINKFEKGKYISLEIYFTNHIVNSSFNESMEIVIQENINGEVEEIYKKKIKFNDKDLFINKIKRDKRLKNIVDLFI